MRILEKIKIRPNKSKYPDFWYLSDTKIGLGEKVQKWKQGDN